MLQVHQLSLRLGDRRLFDSAEFQINSMDRVGLVGPNGAGKTTLLKILTKKVEADQFEFSFPADARIGYLPQEAIVESSRTIIAEVESSATTIQELRKRQKEAEDDLGHHPSGSEAYTEAIHRLSHYTEQLELHESHKLESKAETILQGLGFAMKDMKRLCSEFSGGWQMRIALAKLLLVEPDLLMLDEPTNHLDIHSLRWLESYLKQYQGALLLVSHDRRFLDAIVNRIHSIENAKIAAYTGNYGDFEIQQKERREQLERTKKSQDRKIAETERFIERFRAQASKATQVQSRIKQLDKVERIEIEATASKINFRFPSAHPSGREVVKLENVAKSYDNLEVLKQINLTIERDDRVALVGINGAGKSTMARLIAQRQQATKGSITLGHNVKLGYFAQDQAEELDPTASVYETALKFAENRNETEIRNTLGAFLFGADDLIKKVAVLSGGEKNRLALARLLLKPFNFLILDEPTNHLDMASKSVLQQALVDFSGTIFMVSHDRDFTAPIANRILEVEEGKLIHYPGTLEEYLWKLDQDEKLKSKSSTDKSNASNKGNSKTSSNLNSKEKRKLAAAFREKIAPLRKELNQLESDISSLEEKIEERTQAMIDPEFFNQPKSAEKTTEYHRWETELEKKLARWEKVQIDIEKASAESEGE